MIPSSTSLPLTTFPTEHAHETSTPRDLFDTVRENLRPVLILSDPEECNKNFSIVLKTIVDHLAGQKQLYHLCSKLALCVLRLTLFVKNYRLCIGKLLGLVEIISSSIGGSDDTTKTLEAFVLVVFLLVLKLSAEEKKTKTNNNKKMVAFQDLLVVLEELNFFNLIGRSIAQKTTHTDYSREAYFLLKFDCDIIYLYLYEVVMLSEQQFELLTESDFIPNVVDHLLSVGLSHDVKDEEAEEIRNLVAYEEFKLLLLINEQYMMRNLTTNNTVNKVFESLSIQRGDSTNGICAFINILAYHMNREESHVLKILMLKFLYLVFTSSYSARLPYLNDVKILVDIAIRELNNLNYCSVDEDGSLLALTYMKVLFPLLKFSQLKDLRPTYKSAEITDVLSNIILNCESVSERECDPKSCSRASTMVKTAVKCLSIPYLKAAKPPSHEISSLMSTLNDSSDSINSQGSTNFRVNKIRLQSGEDTSSTESFSLARVSSVKAINKNDYHKANGVTGYELIEKMSQNCNGAFDSVPDLGESISELSSSVSSMYSTSLPLPKLPALPIRSRELTSAVTSILMKAKQKKAPPPPPPPPPPPARRRK